MISSHNFFNCFASILYPRRNIILLNKLIVSRQLSTIRNQHLLLLRNTVPCLNPHFYRSNRIGFENTNRRNGTVDGKVSVVDAEAYSYDDEVIKKTEAKGKPGLVEITAKQDSFIFTVESTGAVKASQLLLNAIEIVKQKLDAVRLSEDTVEADDQFGELGAHMRGG
ncbi:hypothetical protein RYX36_016346 [Vicia faba]